MRAETQGAMATFLPGNDAFVMLKSKQANRKKPQMAAQHSGNCGARCCSGSGRQEELPCFSDHSCWACHLHETFVQEPDLTPLRAWSWLVSSALFSVAGVGLIFAIVAVPALDGALPRSADAAGGSGPGGGAAASWLQMLAAAATALVAALSYHAATLTDSQVLGRVKRLYKNEDEVEAGEEAKAEAEMDWLGDTLARAIRLATVSFDYNDTEGRQADLGKMQELHALLRASFPRVFATLEVTPVGVGGSSLIIEWPGTDPSLLPVMLCAHLDVVPAVDPAAWTHPPFSGHIDEDGVVWGRGAIDNKHNVICQLAAVESALAAVKDGHRPPPRRTLILALGHDEEVGGSRGAAEIAKVLEERLLTTTKTTTTTTTTKGAEEGGGKAGSSSGSGSTAKARAVEFIFDEGPMILKGAIPGKPDMAVGFIGNAEKGAVNVKVEVDGVNDAQHSSSPPLGETNVGVLAAAIAKLEANPFPAHIDSYFDTLTFLGSQLPFALRVVVANPWLFGPVLRAVVLRNQRMAPLVRTTTSVTVVRAGQKVNAVPGKATAFVNHRIHPKDVAREVASPGRVVAYDRKVIGDPRVKLSPFGFSGGEGGDGSSWTPVAPVSPVDGFGFTQIQATVAEVFDVPVAPLLMTGNTDTRHYWNLSTNIYRFSPITIRVEDVAMFHGPNERISKWNLLGLKRFYARLLERTVFMVDTETGVAKSRL